MGLYFGNNTTIITTIMLLVLICYMIFLTKNREKVKGWGRHILFLDIYGLYICCYAATRDGLHLTIQNAIDGSVAPGLFKLISIPTIAGTLGAAMIIISGLICLFVRKQSTRKTLCFITLAGIILKVVVVELSRILM